jgi:hypothetical protein
LNDHRSPLRSFQVNGRRGVDEHIELYVAYAARVAQLPPPSWDRMRLRCASLSEPTFRSLLRRASLAARPHELWVPGSTPPARWLKVITGLNRVVQTSLGVAAELAREFETQGSVSGGPRRRPRSTGKPSTDAYIDACMLVESALAPIQRADPGVATVVSAAGLGVLQHDWLAPADFDAVYSLVEPEIPFANLEPPSAVIGS